MTKPRPTLGFVGLGAMGFPIAQRLLSQTDSLAVFDVRSEPIAALEELGARACGSATEVGALSEVVFVSLPSPAVVTDVAGQLLESRALKIYVDLSTTGPVVAREVAELLSDAEVDCLDAPVSGGPRGAENGTLTTMVSGDRAVFEAVVPLLEVFSSTIVYIGETPGQGQVTKLINNLMSATAIAITSEAVSLGVKAGIDPDLLLAAVNASSGRNTASAEKFPHHVLTRTFDFGGRMSIMSKDVKLCLEEADRQSVPMLIGGAVRQLWGLADATADEGADLTTIAQMIERWAGVTIERNDRGVN
jgi:3-hydroxyisobutyrate dehydrogenase-like beta-hydroxyacid dehydrogenase